MYPSREVFPNPPLEYVAAEIRYPYAPRLRQQQTLDDILLAVQGQFPILRPQAQLTVTGSFGGAVNQQFDTITRAQNKSSDMAMTVSPTSMTVDTTAYGTFDQFSEVVAAAVEVVEKYGSVAAVERVGLRYINEIRVPAPIEDVRHWQGWVSDSLLGFVGVGVESRALQAQGVVDYEVAPDQHLIFRCIAALEGMGVIGDNPLRRRRPVVDGPFFVIDLDSYWQPAAEQAPDFDAKAIMDVVDKLHGPVGMAFQSGITERLRDEVLRRS